MAVGNASETSDKWLLTTPQYLSLNESEPARLVNGVIKVSEIPYRFEREQLFQALGNLAHRLANLLAAQSASSKDGWFSLAAIWFISSGLLASTSRS